MSGRRRLLIGPSPRPNKEKSFGPRRGGRVAPYTSLLYNLRPALTDSLSLDCRKGDDKGRHPA